MTYVKAVAAIGEMGGVTLALMALASGAPAPVAQTAVVTLCAVAWSGLARLLGWGEP